jgi:uncharacterized membrane-anchored protein YjiN (DUF445 family)
MPGDVEIKVGADLVRPVLEAKIQAAIASELHNADGLMHAAIAAALSVKVNDKGRVDKSDYYNRETLIEWLAKTAIHKAAEAAIREWVEKQQPKLQKALEQQLAKKTGGIAKAMVEGLAETLKDNWKFNVTCNFVTPKDY